MPTKEQIEAIIKELQKIMFVQDWEIEFEFKTGREMVEELHQSLDTEGYYCFVKQRNYFYIALQSDGKENLDKDGWYHSLVHEMKHLQTIDFKLKVNEICDMIDDNKHIVDSMTEWYESMVDKQATEFCKIFPVSNFSHILNEKAFTTSEVFTWATPLWKESDKP